MQGVPRYIDFRIRTGKIELKMSQKGFEEHDKDWKKTKIELNLWDEQLLKIGQYKKIGRARVKLEAKIGQSAFLFFFFFLFVFESFQFVFFLVCRQIKSINVGENTLFVIS